MSLVVFFHGLGKRDPDYAQPLIERITEKLPSKLRPNVTYLPIYYGDILQNAESIVTSKLEHSPLYKREHFKSLRPPLDDFIMDAFQSYWPPTRQRLIDRVQSKIRPLYSNGPFHLVLHSWGAVTAMSQYQGMGEYFDGLDVKSWTTMGCPLHLSDAGRYTFPDQITKHWTNFFHSMDLIGAPLNSVYKCTDIEVLDAGPPTELVGPLGLVTTGVAHNCYWESNQIAEHVAGLLV